MKVYILTHRTWDRTDPLIENMTVYASRESAKKAADKIMKAFWKEFMADDASPDWTFDIWYKQSLIFNKSNHILFDCEDWNLEIVAKAVKK